MQNVWALASLWVGLALVATLLAIWFKISTALTEIVVGTVAQLFIGALVGPMGLGAKSEWITFLAGTGAIVLTFLAGAELDPVIFRTKWKEAMVVGLVGFFGPFLGCTAIAHYVLHWTVKFELARWRGAFDNFRRGGLRRHVGARTQQDGLRESHSRGVLRQRFRDSHRLGAHFFTVYDSHAGLRGCRVSLFSSFCLSITPRFFKHYGGRVSELEAKYILFLLFAHGRPGCLGWKRSGVYPPT